MRARRALNVALILAALAAAAIVVLTARIPTTGERLERAHALLTVFRPNDIRRIVIESKGETTILERSTGEDGQWSWAIRSPVQEPADPAAVDRLIAALDRARPVRRVEAEGGAGLGLRPPRVKITLETAAGRQVVELGEAAITPSGARYVRVGPTEVAVIDRETAEALAVGLAAVREKQLVPYLQSELSKVALEGAGGERVLVREEAGELRLQTSQASRRVSPERLNALLLQIARLRAEQFLEIGEARAKLAKAPTVRLVLTPADPTHPRYVLVVGGRCDEGSGVIAVRESPMPAAACVPADTFTAFSLDEEALVDRSLSSLSMDEVERFSLRLDGINLELRRAGTGFSMLKPRRAAVDLTTGNQAVAGLVETEGEIVAAPEGWRQAGVLELWSAAEEESKVRKERVDFGRHADVLYAKRSDGTVLRLSAEAEKALHPDPKLLAAGAEGDAAAP